jgi:tetratricopeptide (TPR) repeat protein
MADRHPTILVCPIDTMTDDEGVIFLSLCLAPQMRRDLFCVQEISVIPGADTSVPVKAYFLNEQGIARLGRAHGADMVVLGMMRREEDRVAVDLQVYDIKAGIFLLKAAVVEKPTNIFKLERKLVYQVIDCLGIHLTDEEEERLESSRPRKLAAAVEYGRGLRSEQKEDLNEALMAYDSAVFADDDLAVPYADEARIYHKYNAPLRAMESYENAIARDRYFAEAWYHLNLYAAEYKNDNEAAVKYCKQAVEIAPRFGKARLSLGARLYALGDLEGAIEEARLAVSLLPTSALARYNLGIFYARSGDSEQARTWFNQALTLDPAFEYAREELRKLDEAATVR